MDNDRIKTAVAKNKVFYFISPHFDDMAYSASMLANELSKTNKVIVVNVFTEATEPPYTRAAKRWMKRCGYDDATKFFKDRKAEDKTALATITTNIIDLGFADAPWRKRQGRLIGMIAKIIPEFANIRGSLRYRYYSRKGQLAKADPYNFQLILEKLRHIIDDSNAEILCPLGVGSHFDHLMTRQAIDTLFDNPIYWEDYPYIAEHEPIGIHTMTSFEYTNGTEAKSQIIAAYASQYKAMFGDTAPKVIPERYYYMEKSS